MRRLLLIATVISAMGCNVTQFLPPGEYLYRGASVEVTAPDSVATDELDLALTAALNQNTNQKIPLIGYRNIWRYYKFEEKKRKKPEKYADDPEQTKGEEPIFYDQALAEGVNTLLVNRAANIGYFTSESSHTVDTIEKNREVSLDYTVQVGAPYFIDTVSHYWTDTSVAHVLDSVNDATLIREGDRYNLDAIKAERQRWQQALKNEGYFYANANDFLFLADTVQGEEEVTMLAKLKNDVPKDHLLPQRVVEVNVYPNVDVTDTVGRGRMHVTEAGGLKIHCDDCPLRPKILDEGFAVEEGLLYSPDRHRRTLQRLASYNTFRYISLDYKEVPGSDSTLILNAYMEPQPRRRIDAELGLTYNSARYVGPNVRVAYTNRNLLRGAELFKLEGDFSYVVFLGNQDEIRVPRSGIYGLTATLNIPRLWLPYRRKIVPHLITSGTVISLGAKLESLSLTLSKFRQEIRDLGLTDLRQTLETDPMTTENVSLLQIRAEYGYTWQREIKTTHAFNPLSVRIQDPVIRDAGVLQLANSLGINGSSDNSATAASRFDRMIVYSPNYTLTYDTRLDGEDTNNFFWQQYLSMNFNNIFPLTADNTRGDRIQSIYPQVETDLRYYHNFTQATQLAMRIHGGVAYPLTERAIVPYFDLYSIGGPNSLRGFAPRQLGPGRTAPQNNNLLTLGGYGNLLLESSVEIRHKVTSLIGLAAFVDAGNVWTYKTEAEPLDTDLRTTAFINELGIDYGIGFRFDLTFLIFRIDLAKPFQIPYESAVADFQIPQSFVGDPVDRSIRLVIGFGYPF